jgi:hypothetical protein
MRSLFKIYSLLVLLVISPLSQAPDAFSQDECLVGTWDVVASTVVGDLRAIARTTDINWAVLGGQYRLTFTADGRFTNVKNHFRLQGEFTVNAVPMKVVQDQNAQTGGRYAVETPRQFIFWVESSTGTATSHIYVSGSPVGDPQTIPIADPITGESKTNPYTCAADTLKILGTGRPGGAGADWVEFRRVRP